MADIRFEPLNRRNLRDFVRLTRETLWMPAYPGDEAVRHEAEHWAGPTRQSAFLIRAGREGVGRLVAPRLEDWVIARDVGLRDRPGLAAETAAALLEHARASGARALRAVVHEPIWNSLAALGAREQKRRLTMRRDLHSLPIAGAADARAVSPRDEPRIAELLHAAYENTVDGEGGDAAGWRAHAEDIFRSWFGSFLAEASFVSPPDPPFFSATLVVECAPLCGLLGQVATHPAHTNRGHARRLIARSLAALARLGYRTCFLEVTQSNDNAVHLYRSLGFQPVGPQIVYGEYRFP